MSRFAFLASVLESADVPRCRASVIAIVGFVARRHGISPAHIYGDSRRPEFVRPRQQVMWLADKLGYSSAAIGRELGRDHSTVLHGIKAEDKRVAARNARVNAGAAE